jgi:hypothetical protein
MIQSPTLSYIVKNLKGQDKRKWVSRKKRHADRKNSCTSLHIVQGGKETNKGNVLFLLAPTSALDGDALQSTVRNRSPPLLVGVKPTEFLFDTFSFSTLVPLVSRTSLGFIGDRDGCSSECRTRQFLLIGAALFAESELSFSPPCSISPAARSPLRFARRDGFGSGEA